MKILRVISSLNPANGGPINGLNSSTPLLIEKGHEVEVLSLDDPLSPWISSLDYRVTTFKGSGGAFQYNSKFKYWLDNNVENYDVVIIHGLWQFHSYSTAKACIKSGVPYVLFTHGMLDPWFNKGSLLKTLKKTIYWKFFESFSVNNASTVLFTSQEECELARLPFSPYSASEKVVSYGSPSPKISVDFTIEKFMNNFPALKGKRFALFLSRIHPKKGIDLIIDAIGCVDNLPENFMLAIAGPDSEGLKIKLIKQLKKLGLEERVIWLGMLQGSDKWAAFMEAEVFILPSHQENFGIVVAESLSTGTPVLISNKVNIWREIKDSGAGLVQNDDIKGVINLLNEWFKLTETEKANMGRNAKDCYQSNFSIESAADDLESELLNAMDIA